MSHYIQYLDDGLARVEGGNVDHAQAVHVAGAAEAGLVLHLGS